MCQSQYLHRPRHQNAVGVMLWGVRCDLVCCSEVQCGVVQGVAVWGVVVLCGVVCCGLVKYAAMYNLEKSKKILKKMKKQK